MPTLSRSGGIKNTSVHSVTLNYMVCSQESKEVVFLVEVFLFLDQAGS